MRLIIQILLCTILGISFSMAQNVPIDGALKDIDNNSNIEGATVKAISGGNTVSTASTNRRGKYTIEVPVGAEYTIEYSKSGFVTKIMKIDLTEVTDEDLPIGGKIFPPIDIDLFEERPNADFSFTKSEPVVTWSWDSKKLLMDYDRDLHARMKEKIESKLEKADKEAKENEAKYNKLIAEADAHYDKEEFKEALDKYEQAINIPGKGMEEHPNMRIIELDDIIQQQAKEELEKQQSGQKYQELLAEADELVDAEKYDKAIDKYYEAIDVQPDEVYPLEQIDKINVLLKEKQVKEEYDQLVEMGDNFLEQNSIQAARDKYQRAHDLLPDETYAKEKLDEIEGKLKEEEEKLALKKQYDEAIEAADKHFDNEEWEDAKERYQEAYDIESASTYPKQRLELVEEKLAEIEKEKENQEKYQVLVEEGDEALESEQFEFAIEKYDEALTFVDEQYAKDQKEQAQKELEKLEDAAAKEEKINELLESAAENISNQEFEAAIKDYDAVLGLEDENATALEGKENAIEELEKLQLQEELKEQFDEIVKNADELLAQEEFEEAKEKYQEANDLIEDDEHVNAKLIEIEEKLNELASKEELKAKVEALIDLAESAEEEEEFNTALDKYNEALGLDENNDSAKDGAARMEDKIKELEEQKDLEERYEKIITEADNLLDAEKYEDAKEKYQDALNVKDEDEYATEKIAEIEQTMEEKAEEIAQKEAFEQAMETGNTALENNSFENAIEAFQEALSIFEEDEDASEKLEKAQNLKQDYEKFTQLKQEGSELIDQEDWDEAKNKYNKAKEINEDEEVKNQLELINQKLNELASEEEKDEIFAGLIGEAEDFEQNDEIENAIAKYQEAIEVKEDETAQNKIEELNELLEQRSQEASAYETTMEQATKAFEEEDFAKAIELYDDALEIKDEDADALEGKEKAKQELKRLAEEEEAYQELLANAMEKKEADELLEAKELFKEAQNQRPQDAIPQNAIVEIDELLRIREEESEDGKAYNDAIEQADLLTQNSDFENAIEKYEEASEIKPDEDYPKEKIEELREIIEQLEAESNLEQEYAMAIDKADLAFANENFEESITLYEEALNLKGDEDYPKNQIEEAKYAIEKLEENQIEEAYQLALKKGNQELGEENYQQAIENYDDALELKPSDPTASEQRNKAAQLLEQQKQEELANQEKQEEFDKVIAEADELFDNEDYITSKERYEEALGIFGNDAYALERREAAIQKSKEKAKQQADEQYQKVLDKADEYFDDENWDKAISLYERARGLREKDDYPRDKLSEIDQIMSGEAKKDQTLEYLGKKESISLVEGAALLEEGERDRKNLKTQKTVDRIKANEQNFQEKNESDQAERYNFQNEIEEIKNRRASEFDGYQEERQQLAVDLDDEMFEISKQRIQENKYERGSVLRQNEELNYRIDDYNKIHEEKGTKHLDNADKMDEIRFDYEKHKNQINSEAKDKWIGSDQELTKVIDDQRADTERAEDLRKDNDRVVQTILNYQEEQRFQSQQDNYDKLLDIEKDATLAKIERAKREGDKAKVQELIEADIAELQNLIRDKNYDETQKVRKEALKADEILIAAYDQYQETKENSDDNRLKTVEDIKVIERKNDEEIRHRNKRKYQKIQENMDEVEAIQIMNEIAKHEMEEGHVELRQQLDREEDKSKQIARQQRDDDQLKRRQTENLAENVKILNENIHRENRAQIDESNEKLKGDQIKLEASKRYKDADQREKLLDNQSKIDKKDFSKKEKPIIPNTIGDEYPEGVTEETFIKKDKEGIPVQIIVRRVVVTDGRGIEYRRVQTRNGVAYSKNGSSITEATWINETQNANLVQN